MLQLDALRLLRNPSGIANLYHLLGYPADQDAPEYSPEEIEMKGAAAGDVRQVWLLVDLGEGSQGLQHIHFEVKDLHAATLRRITEQYLDRPGEYLFTFAERRDNFDRLVFVKPRRDGGSIKLGRLTVQPSRPTAHDLSLLREIALKPGQDAQSAHREQVKAFNVERVTRRFYDEYKALFEHVREVIRTQNPDARIGRLERNKTSDKPSLHAFTQRLLGRVIFLYFIQKKGWLDHNPDFIADLYSKATRHPGGDFYRDALEPLFFNVLNTPRPGNASDLGEIPYLNGSLFEREYPGDTELYLPNSLFNPRVTGSVLHTLGGYNFTIAESSALEQDVSLDPEMLGKVFENMMEEEEARKSGTFYTPRSIVQFMAEETLTRYLSDTTGIPQERLLPLCADDSETHDLTPNEANAIIRALAEVRVLDPAVGTASMLVGFLNAMIRVRRSAEARRGVQVAEGSPALAQWKREYIQHCLYGVDIKQEAIEIARLRLWLSLVVDAREAEPLPNLDYKLMAGDGLLETVDGAPFIKVESALIGGQALVAEKARQIEQKHEVFFGEDDPDRRRALREEIQQLERELFKADVDDRIHGLNSQITRLDNQISHPTLGERGRAKLVASRTILLENMSRLIDQKIKVWDEKEPLPFFLHNVHFAEVMKGERREGNGGFDIVMGNPPYVSIGNMTADYKTALRNAFPSVESGRADLYVYFYQKGLNLLREGGRLAYITPNKFMRAEYGEKLRGILRTKTRIEMLADFGDLPVFDATTYPLVAIMRKNLEDSGSLQMLPERTLKVYLGSATGEGVSAVREALGSFNEFARKLVTPLAVKELSDSGWTLDDPRMLRLLDKMRGSGRTLGEIVQNKFYRGIVTGYNRAFVIDEVKRQELIELDAKSIDVIKPFLRGREIGRWKPSRAKRYVILAGRGFDIEKYPAIKAWLSQFKSKLESRATADLHEWYELQQPQQAYWSHFENSDKIFYQEIASSQSFALISDALYANNKCFMIPVSIQQRWLLALLNSKPIWLFLDAISSKLVGGAFALQEIYLKQLPVVIPTPEQATILESFTDDSRLPELNALIYEMYGLTPSEIELVEALTTGAYTGTSNELAENEADEEAEAVGA